VVSGQLCYLLVSRTLKPLELCIDVSNPVDEVRQLIKSRLAELDAEAKKLPPTPADLAAIFALPHSSASSPGSIGNSRFSAICSPTIGGVSASSRSRASPLPSCSLSVVGGSA
jgi:hypothetical protein